MRCPSHRGRSRHGREICAPPGELRSPTALDVRGRVNSWFLNYNCNNWDDPAAKNFFKLNYKTYMNAKKSIVQEQSLKNSRRLLTSYDCIECDMANDAWKHWKELVQYVCCLAALGPLKARVASRRRTHHPFEAGSAPTRQPLPERPLDYHDNVTTETVQRLTIAPSHDNLVKRVRINVLIAPIIDQEIGLLLKNWNILWNTETAEIQLQCKTTHTCFEMK